MADRKLPQESRRMAEQVSAKADRKEQARRRGDRSIWFGLGMFGMVGWSVAIPTLLGAALGAWIDASWPGRISWTLTGLAVGVLLGCLLAWNWVRRESRRD